VHEPEATDVVITLELRHWAGRALYWARRQFPIDNQTLRSPAGNNLLWEAPFILNR